MFIWLANTGFMKGFLSGSALKAASAVEHFSVVPVKLLADRSSVQLFFVQRQVYREK